MPSFCCSCRIPIICFLSAAFIAMQVIDRRSQRQIIHGACQYSVLYCCSRCKLLVCAMPLIFRRILHLNLLSIWISLYSKISSLNDILFGKLNITCIPESNYNLYFFLLLLRIQVWNRESAILIKITHLDRVQE